MKAATYTRSWRRSRNVNRSDCQSWLGSARSKRTGEGLAPGLRRAASRLGARPSSCSTRRTVVSEAPRPKKRFSTSRMRRLPACGCACLTASTACRRASGLRVRVVSGFAATRRGANACTPPARYLRAHSLTVVYGMFSSRDTSRALIPWSTIIATAAFITSNGHIVLRLPAAVSAPSLPPRCVFAFTLFAPSGPLCTARSEEGC